MRKILYLICLLFVITSNSYADRSILGFNSFDEFRQLGEYRLWTFISQDSVIGTFVSTVKERVNINGVSGFSLEQKLKLDYNKTSTDLIFDIFNQHYVANNGIYLGNKMQLTINDQSEEIFLERDKTILQGYTTRGKEKIDQNVDLRDIKYAVEYNYIDELELYLATLDITVGTEINDTIFMSQSLIESFIYGFVEDYKNVQLYNQVFDSAFVIELMYPTMMTAYFTPDKRLVKLVVPSQELKIYQDAVTNPLKTKLAGLKAAQKGKIQTTTQLPSKRSISKLILVILLYASIAVVISLFFIKKNYKEPFIFIFTLVGGISFIVIPFTQIPIQEYLFTKYFVPHVIQAQESPLVWGILPAISAGLIQGLLLCMVLISVYKLIEHKKQYVTLGAVVGLGFGLIEASYLAYGIPSSLLFGINFVERAFLILFHISAGAILGYAFKDSLGKFIQTLFIIITINSIFRYLPIFAQTKSLTPELLGILLAFISVIFFTMVVFLTKRDV